MGEQPNEPEDLFSLLDGLGIAHKTHWHAPVFTVAESQSLRDQIAGAHTKNLFLKDKKGCYFLIVLEENATVDLKQIHHVIGASGRVSFGKPEVLMERLGVVPGAVTVFAAMNDVEGTVTIILDAMLMEAEIINAHPLRNTATTSIASRDLMTFLTRTGHQPQVLKIST
ncbi:prolyl-tRNA synthetase associated domain-containing protein [Pseudohoeflea coraliihabitans]|uniref:Prolyl-tRNA synthetase associated domain-containing protein n=1 Tax=Pseudohoeflea coraliihabitans TaxID=2860393 RepID=A0ABS6WME1_9HYPH|nr:YbaK/EbsC family protein [Pseudohoeflea sp. DP4N28-3]MBW3096813.1 prolyl-tRNA synthetase associated domain-containing protein [Pseudohoeflea sp. DP4N28-3]